VSPSNEGAHAVGGCEASRNWKFESISLQQRVRCEPDFSSTPRRFPLRLTGPEDGFGEVPMVRIHLPPVESPTRDTPSIK
jgi:hypothetical protein